mgnify:CR=1 FL=1
MKVGKYDIRIEKREAVNALIMYALLFTIFTLFTENSGKQSFLIAICTSGVGLLWNTFWFNYYEYKKRNNLLSKE